MLKIKIASTKKEREDSYKIRFKVFGEIEHYLKDWEKIKSKKEYDEYDEEGLSVIFNAYHGDKPVGTVRIIPGNTVKTVVEDFVSLEKFKNKETNYAEASRLCVIPEYRGKNGRIDGIKIVDALCKIYFTYCLYNNISKVFVLANTNRLHIGKAQETHGRMGFEKYGKEFFLKEFSEYAMPMMSDLTNIPEKFRDILAENWKCIEKPYNFCFFPDKNIDMFWDEFAETAYDEYLNINHYQKFLETVSMYVDDVESIADIGCGSGNFISRLTEKKKINKIIGVDISEKMLELARVKNSENERIRFYKGDAKELPIEGNDVECAVAFNLLFHFKDPSEIIKELIRISKKYIIISGPLNSKNIISSMQKQLNGKITGALNYNQILVNRNGLKFLPDAYKIVELGNKHHLNLVKYDTAYDGLSYIAKFQKN